MQYKTGHILGILIMVLMVISFQMQAAWALDVQGVIDSQTRWSINDSPVQVMGNVIVSEPAELTIEAGVTVVFMSGPEFAEGYHLTIDGALVARGTLTNPIVFTAFDRERPWGTIRFRDSSRDWDPSTATGCILEFCIIEYGGDFAEGGAMISTFNARPFIVNNAIRFSAAGGISAFVIPGADDVAMPSGMARVFANRIYSNPFGVMLSGTGGTLRNNFFLNNSRAVDILTWTHDTVLGNNTIISTATDVEGSAIRLQFGVPPIITSVESTAIEATANALKSEATGTILLAMTATADALFELTMTGNNFDVLDNDGYAAIAYEWPEAPLEVDMADNWWGTTDTAIIDALIYDAKSNYRLPVITYQPLANQAFESAGSSLGYPSIANAGPDLEVSADQSVVLDGSFSYDPYGTATYQWQQVSGPEVTLRDARQASASFIAPLGGLEGELLGFRLTVTNTGGFPHSDEATVTILADPEFETVDVGGCFIRTTQSDVPQPFDLHTTITSIATINMIAKIAKIMIISLMGLGGLYIAASRRLRLLGLVGVLTLLTLLTLSPLLSSPAQAGYLAAGGGMVLGEEEDTYSFTLESGALDIDAAVFDLLFGIGLFLVPRGDNNIPEGTIASPCPNDQCIALDSEKKGTEVGMFAKFGVELGPTNLYLTAIGGFALFTESELSRSPATGLVYETSSESSIGALYGGGLSFFPEVFNRQLVFQVEYDNVRGITGTVGWYW